MEPFACSPAPLALKAVTSHRTPQSSPFWGRPRFFLRQPGNREDYGVRRGVAALGPQRSGETGQAPRSARRPLSLWAKTRAGPPVVVKASLPSSRARRRPASGGGRQARGARLPPSGMLRGAARGELECSAARQAPLPWAAQTTRALLRRGRAEAPLEPERPPVRRPDRCLQRGQSPLRLCCPATPSTASFGQLKCCVKGVEGRTYILSFRASEE